jgi:hypothetical protein
LNRRESHIQWLPRSPPWKYMASVPSNMLMPSLVFLEAWLRARTLYGEGFRVRVRVRV